MEKIEVLEPGKTTPTQQMMQDREAIIDGSRGRKLKIKNYDVLREFYLVDMLGDETAANRVYMGMVMPLLCLTEIDGEPVTFNSRREMEALITRLGGDGMRALRKGVDDHFAEKPAEEQKADLKK